MENIVGVFVKWYLYVYGLYRIRGNGWVFNGKGKGVFFVFFICDLSCYGWFKIYSMGIFIGDL